MRLRDRDETAFDEGPRHWKKLGTKIQTLENATALSWLAAAAAGGIRAVGEWSPPIRSLFLFARAPENEDEKTGGTNRAARAAVVA